MSPRLPAVDAQWLLPCCGCGLVWVVAAYKLLPDLNSTLNATTGPGMIQMQAQQGALTPTFLPPNDTVPFPRDYYVSIAVSSFNVTGCVGIVSVQRWLGLVWGWGG